MLSWLRPGLEISLLLLSAAIWACATEVPVPKKASPGGNPTQTPIRQSEEAELGSIAPLNDQEARRLMEDLLSRDREAAAAALEQVMATHDLRFISVLIELMRAAEIGIARQDIYSEVILALEELSEESFDRDWPAWVEWYGGTRLMPPPGFTSWKGRLLGRIDPRFEQFLHDDLPSVIRPEEIQWGGVKVDGIPALDRAEMLPAEQADYLLPEEPVFGLSIGGESRAYPLRIMDWHEMANDSVGGVPISLAYCTLCGAGIAFSGRASNGETYTFGSSGLLFRSNKLMYDRETHSLWNQLTGEPVLGRLAGRGVSLEILPVVLTTWEAWLLQHPDTEVLSLETGYERLYLPGAPYGDYFASDRTMFPVWQRSDLLPTKARIYAVRVDGVPKAYPVDRLLDEGVVNDFIVETAIVLVASRGRIAVEGVSLREGAVTYDAGAEVRAYFRGDETFRLGPGPDEVLDSQGRIWRVTETALLGPEGELAPRMSGHLAYWFGWHTFFPTTLVYGETQGGAVVDPYSEE